MDTDCDGHIDEHFVDDRGAYMLAIHCGGCGIACAEVFPDARATECVDATGGPTCRVVRCGPDHRLDDDGVCVPDVDVLCLPCEEDTDCTQRSLAARCLRLDDSFGRCGQICESGRDCPDGFVCETDLDARDRQCRPRVGTCECTSALVGSVFGCDYIADDSTRCAGKRTCRAGGLTDCEPAFEERCNGEDDDCDGRADEGFVDGGGRYVSTEHCGACGAACVPQGPNMLAECDGTADDVGCVQTCEPGFVDVDGFLATGCECRISPRAADTASGDSDCDGAPDPAPALVFVSPTGDDGASGIAPEAPVRSLQVGLALAVAAGRDVWVARGIYPGPVEVPAGVSLLGGYSPNFRERDRELYPVVIEAPDDSGAPVLLVRQVDTPMRVEQLTVVAGHAASAGTGSTGVLLDRCSAAVSLSEVTVISARGGDGVVGTTSSDVLVEWGFGGLPQLAGNDGASGLAGNTDSVPCPASIAGGAAGEKTCPTGPVSGGAGGLSKCAALPECDNMTDTPCGNAGCADFTTDGVCDLDAALAIAAASEPAARGSGPGGGAAGPLSYSSPTNHGVCSFCDDNPSLLREGGDGHDGAAGDPGLAGVACDATPRLDLVVGRIASAGGGDGSPGSDGGGGGGGTAGAGRAVIANTTGSCSDVAGGGGGGGGSGGCGAPGATGGGGGGASVGILVVLADEEGPTLFDVRVVTASGGDGGAGGFGAAGGAGGVAGLGGASRFWCARQGGRGGDGGGGGAGGGGAGGCGGGSFGIYVVPAEGVAPNGLSALPGGVVIELGGTAGRGGLGGVSPGKTGPGGRNGVAADLFVHGD